MALAGNKQSNEVRFCWEQVLRTNPLFRISAAFAPADRARQLLPLYALFSAVEEICSEHSDEDLARRKLDWWRQECALLESRGSEHPVLRELVHSGAYGALRKESLARLFDNAETRFDPPTPADVDDLQAVCTELSQPQFELELALSNRHQAMPRLLGSIGAVSGLAQLLREAARRRPPADYWWLPVTLLARHGASRADISRDGKVDASARPVFADLLESCLGWIPPPEAGGVASEPEIAAARHLFVMSKLQIAALRRLQPSQPRQFAIELNRVGLPQLYLAWKAARSIGVPAA